MKAKAPPTGSFLFWWKPHGRHLLVPSLSSENFMVCKDPSMNNLCTSKSTAPQKVSLKPARINNSGSHISSGEVSKDNVDVIQAACRYMVASLNLFSYSPVPAKHKKGFAPLNKTLIINWLLNLYNSPLGWQLEESWESKAVGRVSWRSKRRDESMSIPSPRTNLKWSGRGAFLGEERGIRRRINQKNKYQFRRVNGEKKKKRVAKPPKIKKQ